MINKLYKLKQHQIDQQVSLKQQALSKINNIDNDLIATNYKLNTAHVDTMGAISDFVVLEIHKRTMKEYMVKIAKEKELLLQQIDEYDEIIIELNKESEQFKYILEEMKQEKIKEINKQEENAAAEYMQTQYIKRMGEKNVV